MKPTCIALDFDETLAYYRNGYDGLFEIFTKRGLPKEDVVKTYELSKQQGGFSVDSMIGILSEKSDFGFDDKKMNEEFDEWLYGSLESFPEVENFLLKVKNLGIPIAIVTKGDEKKQKQAIGFLGIPYDELFIVKKDDSKTQSLKVLIDKYGVPIFFVDDKAVEIDRIRQEGIRENEIVAFHLRRPNGRYSEKKTEFNHRKIQNLEEIFE